MKPSVSQILITFVLLPLVITANAQSAEQKGLEIAQAVKQRDIGWGDSQSELTMTLRNKKGQEIVREMRSKSLEVENDGDKGLTIFDTPLDVKGTAFLSFSHVSEPDDQWLYLPALKRVKRIASRNKSGPFLGSEFAFEDLSSFEVEKNTYKYLRDETLKGMDCYVVEMRPTDKYSGYSYMNVWIDKEHLRVHKIDFYDRREDLLKTLTISDYQLYLDKYWRAGKQFMVNHKTGKSTDIDIKNLEFNVGLTEADFNESRLNRAR
ncbi:MAG: outer membrane lipoprotein-sorting protein [Gammaproteobacteria bacterium]|nr:outer membrane lipoprotein-sorting protein [Gammaproteobacteria bacterium]